jgi:hypothetical protein
MLYIFYYFHFNQVKIFNVYFFSVVNPNPLLSDTEVDTEVDSQVDPQPQFAFTVAGVGFIGALHEEQSVCCEQESEQEEQEQLVKQAVGQSVG